MKKVILLAVVSLISRPAFAALTSAQVEAAMTYCLANGISGSDPVEADGAGDQVGSVICVFPDINASLDPPAYIGVKKIKLIME